MTQSEEYFQSPKTLNEDEIIENLVPNPSQVPNVRVLAGFLGKSSREGYWRLYSTAQLNEYVEIREADIVHYQRLSSEQSSLGGTLIWVKRDAELQHTRTTSGQAQASFFQGDISARFLNRADLQRLDAVGTRRRFQIARVYSAFMSCVPEFCEFTIASFSGGGSVYCTEDGPCGNTFQAECP